MKILVLNAGSSSQKSALYEFPEAKPDRPLPPLWEAHIDWTHQTDEAELRVKTAAGHWETKLDSVDSASAIAQMLETLWSGDTAVIQQPSDIAIVGHRVVHGGQDYRHSVRITPEVKATIARLSEFAPVHNPINLQGIEAIEQALGQEIPQVAVFDTAFHAELPPAAYVYPIPHQWLELGIRRYGFHGISHQFCAQRAAQILQRDLDSLRLVTCHLGNGCSLAAIRNGRSIDTTMGFTPLEGLMMGSRSGSIDPGILLYLLRQPDYDPEQLEDLLNHQSGLKGVSGLSGDMRQIRSAIAAGNPQAKQAFDVYVHRLRSQIGAMVASLGGVEALVFTAGVGENDPKLRAAVCESFGFLGLKLDAEKNETQPVDVDIAALDSRVRVLVIHTQEDWAIAQECWTLLNAQS